METYPGALACVRAYAPSNPVFGFRPHVARRSAQWFLNNFPGQIVAYAVKANSAQHVIHTLYNAGIRQFDVASLREIEAVHALPDAQLFFMNPVKPRDAIRRAYHEYGVRTFSLDSADELNKIMQETDNARDLTLVVRITCTPQNSLMPLENKFGIGGRAAVDLLQKVRQKADSLGIAFHVGSQTLAPEAYTSAFATVAQLIAQSGVVIDLVDVGGGFPSIYPNQQQPKALKSFMKAIAEGFESLPVGNHCQLMCEPGRALVAECESLIVRVEARRGSELYINDGAYGALFDASHFGFCFPMRLLDKARAGNPTAAFSLWGPTCDSADKMAGPFLLPQSVREGDYIEIGTMGAYGRVLAGTFNGFGEYDNAVFTDEPMASLYPKTVQAPMVQTQPKQQRQPRTLTRRR